MKNSKPKVVKVIYDPSFGSDKKKVILFDDGKMMDDPIEERRYWYGEVEGPESVSNLPYRFSCDFVIQFGGKEYIRSGIYLHCNGTERKILIIDSDRVEGKPPDAANTGHVSFLIEPKEWKGKLLTHIKHQEKEFYLSEHELLIASHDLLKGEYSWVHFKQHVEIDGCIADAMAFVNHCDTCNRYNSNTKIIGFEAKTNHDNYKRLYDQINSYLSICDEVYLVIEDKDVPKDLPFYVGVIKVYDGASKITRRATSLKHSADVGDCWKTLLKNLCINIGLKRETPLIKFFNTIENIKRKLIWNQFVIGWHQTYVKEYVSLTDDEKKLIKLFFDTETDEDLKPLVKLLTLDNFLGV